LFVKTVQGLNWNRTTEFIGSVQPLNQFSHSNCTSWLQPVAGVANCQSFIVNDTITLSGWCQRSNGGSPPAFIVCQYRFKNTTTVKLTVQFSTGGGFQTTRTDSIDCLGTILEIRACRQAFVDRTRTTLRSLFWEYKQHKEGDPYYTHWEFDGDFSPDSDKDIYLYLVAIAGVAGCVTLALMCLCCWHPEQSPPPANSRPAQRVEPAVQTAASAPPAAAVSDLPGPGWPFEEA
jgi:hypothetical protein